MINFIFLLISFVYLLFSPDRYSQEFCTNILFLYIIVWVYNAFKERKKGIITYNFLFSIAYLFVFFVYPVFLYNSQFRHYILFAYYFNPDYINYCTALALAMYVIYIYGYNYYRNKRNLNQESSHRNYNKDNIYRVLQFTFALTLITFLWFFISNGGALFSKQYQGIDLSESDISAQYIYVLLLTFTTVQSIITFYVDRKKHRIIFILSLSLITAICLFILFTGFRTFSMNVFVMLLVLYNDKINRIKILPAFIAIFFGIIVLYAIGKVRATEIESGTLTEVLSETDTSENYFEFANDFIINNRSLYFLVEYVDNYSYTYGLTWLGGVFGAIPFAAGIFRSISGIDPDLLGSATFNSYLTLGSVRHVGLGTNVVADAYIPFGIIGAIIVFFCYGMFVRFLHSKVSSNIFYSVAYYALVSRVIFTARSGIFMNLQIIVWSVIVLWVVMKVVSKFK